MSKEPNIKKNFLYSTAYQILNVITPFITAPYVSRVLGAEGIGIQSYTASIQYIFLLIASLGTLSYGSREISMHRENVNERSKLFWEIELMVVCTTGIALLGWGFLCLFSVKYRIFYCVLSIGIFANMFDITWFFNGLEQFKLTVVRNSAFKIIGIVLLFALIRSSDDLLLYIFITAVTSLLSNLSLWPYMKRYLVKVDFRKLSFRRHFRETLVYFIPTIASSVYTVLDKTLLGLITNDAAQNGYYQQAEKIINLAKSVVFTALNSVVGVRNAFLFSEKRFAEIHEKIEISFNYIFFMGFGCCFGIMGVARTFVPVFFGTGYDQVVGLLYIFAPIIVIVGISNCLGAQYYTPCGKRKESTNYLIIGSVVNLILNLLMIPRFGAEGAAIASVIAETVVSILYVQFSCGYGNVSVLIKTGGKKMLAGIFMFCIVFYLNQLQINSLFVLVLQVVIGCSTYMAILLVLQDEWTQSMCKKIWRKAKHG